MGAGGAQGRRTRGHGASGRATRELSHQVGQSVPGPVPERRRPPSAEGPPAPKAVEEKRRGSRQRVKPQGQPRWGPSLRTQCQGPGPGGPRRTGPCVSRSSGATEQIPPGFGPTGRGSPGAALITRESSRPLSGQQSPPPPPGTGLYPHQDPRCPSSSLDGPCQDKPANECLHVLEAVFAVI